MPLFYLHVLGFTNNPLASKPTGSFVETDILFGQNWSKAGNNCYTQSINIYTTEWKHAVVITIFFIFCRVTVHVKWTPFVLCDTNVLLVPHVSESYPSFMARSIRGLTIPVKERLVATVKRWEKTRWERKRIACPCRVQSVPHPLIPLPSPPGGLSRINRWRTGQSSISPVHRG